MFHLFNMSHSLSPPQMFKLLDCRSCCTVAGLCIQAAAQQVAGADPASAAIEASLASQVAPECNDIRWRLAGPLSSRPLGGAIATPRILGALRIAMKCVSRSLLFGLLLAVTACTLSSPPSTEATGPFPLPPAWTAVPTPTLPAQSPLVTPTSVKSFPAIRIGYIIFPYLAADAGNFALQAGDTITLSWQEAPLDAYRYEFSFIPDAPAEPIFIGADEQPSDGATAQWLVPESLSGSFEAIAYYSDGHIARAGPSGAIYSGKLPPAGVCALSTGGAGPIDLLPEPSIDATPFAFLLPGSYAEVLQHTTDGWYLVDASEALDLVRNLAASGSGWISDQNLLNLHGPCDQIPLLER